jgi:3-oxoacyl-[acyl-carrier-protein] synthase II
MKQRVCITGMGAVTPIGNTVDAYWRALCAGQSGVDRIDAFDASAFTTQIAAQVRDLDATAYFDNKELRRTARFIQFAVVAAMEAVQQSGLDIESIAPMCGVEIGSGMGGIEVLEEAVHQLSTKGPGRISPFTVPMMIVDMAAGIVSIKTGAKGPNAASVTACASAAHAMARAFQLVRDGVVTAMITGGSEAVVTPLGVGSFCAARSLSTRNDDPKRASRPFDVDRDGFVMGEGAGMLVFESLAHAQARGATILAEVVGFGSSGDAYHITAPAPEGEGGARAMQAAIADAAISPDAIGYINAHGTSTKLNDALETKAIKRVFGDQASQLLISSTKSMTGHLLGAAAAIEAVASVQALLTQTVPPTINLDNPDPECDLNYVPHVKQSVDHLTHVLSNSLGFGGHNASIIFKAFS